MKIQRVEQFQKKFIDQVCHYKYPTVYVKKKGKSQKTYPWLIWGLDNINLKFNVKTPPKPHLKPDTVIMNLQWCPLA